MSRNDQQKEQVKNSSIMPVQKETREQKINRLRARSNQREIIIAPMLTEKSNNLMSKQNSYTFRVSVRANKIEIKSAIEKIFSVDVTDVNTMNFRGKMKRMGRYTGKRADWKKAIVTLKSGQTLPDFEV